MSGEVVLFDGTLLVCTVRTYWARKRFLACVDHHMPSKIVRSNKRFGTMNKWTVVRFIGGRSKGAHVLNRCEGEILRLK